MRDVVESPTISPVPMSVAAGMTPLVGIVFLGVLAIGVPLPGLALYVHQTLGYGALTVGWVVGLQSVATILTRHWAGTRCDHDGARPTVLIGLPVAALAGVFYAASALVPGDAALRLLLLLAGRLVLGVGESLFIVGAMSWGIARLGAARTGAVMSWQGIALYGAIGLGAPIGLAVQARFGFLGTALLTILAPLAALPITLMLPGAAPTGGGHRAPFHRVVGLIWRPGLVLTLATVPFAAMATFIALLYAERGWTGAGLALAGFSAGYVAVRLIGSHWPDRFGGARVAAVSLVVECAGQMVLWLVPHPGAAAIGAVLTGIGFSLVFPSMGVEATRRVRPELRGRAVGNFIAFFDLSLGVTGPAIGAAIGTEGYAAAFLIGSACTLAGLALLPGLRRMGEAGR